MLYKPATPACRKGLGDAPLSGLRGEPGAGHDVECVVVQATVGDHQVIGLKHRRAGQLPVQVAGVLGQVQVHPRQQVAFAGVRGRIQMLSHGSDS